MCGIIAGFNTTKNKEKAEKINDYIVNQYENQYSRGQRGFGIIRINKGKVEVDRACEGTKFLLDLYLKPSSMIIAHHRTPTSTENWLDQTHPMVISNDLLKHDYYVIHNGVITNDRQLHEKHLGLGFVYTTQYEEEGYTATAPTRTKYNDSEAIAIEVAMFIEGLSSVVEIDNSSAFIALQVNKKTGRAEQVYFGKNGSADLNMEKKKGNLIISSEGAGEEVESNVLYSFNVNDNKMKLNKEPIPFERAKPVIKETTNLQLPLKQDLTKEKEVGDVSKDGVRTVRSWVKLEEDPDFEEVPVFDKNYIELMKAEFKERIKENDSTDISATIDDALDEEITKITELLDSYKNILLTDKLEQGETGYFLARMSKVMNTMRVITDMAEEDYNEKILLEDQKEVDDYNAGFAGDADYGTGYIPKERWPGYNKSRADYLNREF